MGCSLPGSSVHGILQAGILEWVAISFSIGISFDTQIWWSRGVHSTWLHRCARCWSLVVRCSEALLQLVQMAWKKHHTAISMCPERWGGESQHYLMPRVIMLRSQEMKLMSLTCSSSSLDCQTLGYFAGGLFLNGNVGGKIRESLMILSWIEGLLISHELNYYIHCTSAYFRTQSSYRINPMRFWLP